MIVVVAAFIVVDVAVVAAVVVSDIPTTNGCLENSTFLVLNLNCCHHFYHAKILQVCVCVCVCVKEKGMSHHSIAYEEIPSCVISRNITVGIPKGS